MQDDEYYMRQALKEAQIALDEGNYPIGAVIINPFGEIVSKNHNQVISAKNRLAHAEKLAIEGAQEYLNLNYHKEKDGKRLDHLTLYTTYDPCPLCLGASLMSRVKRIVTSGANMDNSGAISFLEHLPGFFEDKLYQLTVTSGVLRRESEALFLQGIPVKKLIERGVIKL